MQQAWGRVKLTEVNPHLVCVLCHGYFIDATTMVECPHSFCRSCIILYLETKSYCPICEVQIHKTKPHLNLKPDKTLQDIVYKLVPGLFHSEMRRRQEFYAKHPNHDLYLNPEARGVGVERIIYSPEDSISLSLEYYDDEREREEWTSAQPGLGNIEKISSNRPTDGLKRYLQCPAVVTMSQIKKFIRMKYDLAASCSVEVLYRRESLPDSYSLMDVAYIYTWKRNGPMRFYYRIHVAVPVTHALPALENTQVTEITEKGDSQSLPSDMTDPSSDKQTKCELSESSERSDVTVIGNDVMKPEEARSIYTENNAATARPYASEHDELSVSLLLSLSNGHPKETSSVEAKRDTEQSVLNITDSTKILNSQNRQIFNRPTVQDSRSTENNVAVAKSETTVPPESSTISVNGFTQDKNNTPVVNGPSKPVVKKQISKCFVKPPIKANLGVKNNGQIIKNILANKLTENCNKILSKSVQNNNECNFGTIFNKEQNKIPETKKINDEHKSDPQTACPDVKKALSPNHLTITEKILKSTKYVPSPLVKNNSKKIDSVKSIVNTQKIESKPERNITAVFNRTNTTVENKTLLNTENKSSVSANGQEKTETKKTDSMPNNVQPLHRKEVNRLEQIVKNCMKKGNSLMLSKQTESNLNHRDAAKTETLEASVKHTAAQNPSSKDHRIASSSNGSVSVANNSKQMEVEETSILKRKLKDPTCLISVNRDNPNLLGPPDPKKRRLVTPDVSIELTTHPAHDNKKNTLKRPAECSDLSILTKRFLDSIQQMKKHTASTAHEFNIKDIDQLCASHVKIEKISASHLNSGANKIVTSTLSKSEEKGKSSSDNLTRDNREKVKQKNKDDLVSIAIERINENIRMSEKPNDDRKVSVETREQKELNPEPVPSTSGDKESLPSPSSLKKLPRLIEINAPPRPKLQTSLQDPKLRTGLKMTTVRKEVPIGKEGSLVWKDNTGALDLSSGSPGSPKKPATNSRPAGSSRSPSSLSPLQAMSSFQVPEMKVSPPLRIPNLKHKTPPHLQPRPSSLSSSSPSPPADSRTSEMFSSTAFQHLYRHQLELQSRLMASSQVNNNKWRQDPLSAKKFEEWMRNMINCGGLPPHPHPIMFQSQLGPTTDSHRK